MEYSDAIVNALNAFNQTMTIFGQLSPLGQVTLGIMVVSISLTIIVITIKFFTKVI